MLYKIMKNGMGKQQNSFETNVVSLVLLLLSTKIHQQICSFARAPLLVHIKSIRHIVIARMEM